MRKLPVATLALAALLLSGCVPETPPATLSPTPSATPVFASEEEALAAAEQAYAAYLKVSDQIAQDGGANPERIAPLVTPEWLTRENDSFARLAATGNRQIGASSFRNAELQQLIDSVPGEVEIVLYLCFDASGTRFVRPDGSDITPQDRQTLVSLEVSFEGSPSGSLLISNNEPWSGESFC